MSRKSAIERHIAELREDLLAARKLSTENLAQQIQENGFSCQLCGECCQGMDNSVVVFPFEIRRIKAASGLEWLQAAEPPEEGEYDREGCFHTLEWRLKRIDGSCRFYQSGRCSIYEARPLLCSTYPFYLDRGRLQCSLCRGLGCKIDPEKAGEMAELLILRYTTEIEEAILLLEKYQDFERGRPRKGGRCIVHDSEGMHCIHHKKSIYL
ncbi:Putative zinc- or iron-chelating domain protein [uncultured archaeon]|nr:Putative zinc- or iron-chelating domain protein [uncultured archaeon]